MSSGNGALKVKYMYNTVQLKAKGKGQWRQVVSYIVH